ncbi:MAG: glycosyltransferase [Chitinispirillaceae bacterium]|nr:glycosyltransferase [Chitinispirillaceae bacterium]
MDKVSSLQNPLISIVIVNYKVPEYLLEALRSVYHAELSESVEIIIVDNASKDNSKETITQLYPSVKWVQLKQNTGFGKACNVGAKGSRGKYLLFLNPDTVISKDTLSVSYEFMEKNPEVGIMGPKILNPDGSLQRSCKRGFPTPAVTFYHFLGLSKLFPKNKRFGYYNLTFLDENLPAEVDAISGSFMFIRRDLFLKIGGFDERFFMYGEDLDLCYRIRQEGYKVWYNPATQIIHRKGRSSVKNLFNSRIAFYEAMIIFSKKYKHTHSVFFPSWIVFLGIFLISTINISVNLIRQFRAFLVDLIIINSVLFLTIFLRFSATHRNNPYLNFNLLLLSIHLLLSICFIGIYAYNGAYFKKKSTFFNNLLSGFLASLIFISTIYFVKSIAVSRFVFAISCAITTLLLAGWREVAKSVAQRINRIGIFPEKTIIVGTTPLTVRLIRQIERNNNCDIIGVISDNDKVVGEYEGYPVLGKLKELSSIFRNYSFDTLIISTDLPWYSYVIEALSNFRPKNLTIRWVPHHIASLTEEKLPEEIELKDFYV